MLPESPPESQPDTQPDPGPDDQAQGSGSPESPASLSQPGVQPAEFSPDPAAGSVSAEDAPQPGDGPEPAESAPAPAPPPAESAVAATLEVPPLDSPAAGEGGEWELLTGKVRTFLASGQLQEFWQNARTPLSALLAVVIAAVVLQIYGSLLRTLNSLPLIPGLLELVGLIWILRRGLPKILRANERQQLSAALQRRWKAFLGRA